MDVYMSSLEILTGQPPPPRPPTPRHYSPSKTDHVPLFGALLNAACQAVSSTRRPQSCLLQEGVHGTKPVAPAGCPGRGTRVWHSLL